MGNKDKIILDVACGGRMFWFDKKNPNVLFVDRRVTQPHIVGKGKDVRVRQCLPDKVMDFRKLKLQDNQFSLVVFDPPSFYFARRKKLYSPNLRPTGPKNLER